MRRLPIAIARTLLLALFALCLLAAPRTSAQPAPSPPSGPAFVVIVHSKNAYITLDRAFVADAFLKKTTRWPGGDVIKPVDLPPDSSTRERFSQDVLKRSVAAVKSYWQQIIFSGRDVPPVELSNDDDVVRYVHGHPGAIGYVSGAAQIGDARVVTMR
jgi:ABC-type phosphate transport system substrate-binding protein